MAQNPTKPTAIEAVKDQIARTLRIIDHRIEGLTKEMNEDYLRFFEWHVQGTETPRLLYLALGGDE